MVSGKGQAKGQTHSHNPTTENTPASSQAHGTDAEVKQKDDVSAFLKNLYMVALFWGEDYQVL